MKYQNLEQANKTLTKLRNAYDGLAQLLVEQNDPASVKDYNIYRHRLRRLKSIVTAFGIEVKLSDEIKSSHEDILNNVSAFLSDIELLKQKFEARNNFSQQKVNWQGLQVDANETHAQLDDIKHSQGIQQIKNSLLDFNGNSKAP